MIFLNKAQIGRMDAGIIQTAVEKAYRLVSSNNYNMPDRMHVQDDLNTLLLMPCFSEAFFATKLVSVFPDAPRHGRPVVNGVVVLFDNQSGQPLAIMDGASVTAQRTGAVGGLAVRCLTSESIRAGGIFGAGVQGLSQARYLLFNRRIKTLSVYTRTPDTALKMIQKLEKEFPEVEYVVSPDPETLVEGSEVVIAATTSKDPVFDLPPDRIRKKTFISIGSFRPDMKEFPDSVIEAADDIFVDTLFASEESGDLAIPLGQNRIGKNDLKAFAKIIDKQVYDDTRTYFFKSVGMALFDLTVASAIYQLAMEKGFGQVLEL